MVKRYDLISEDISIMVDQIECEDGEWVMFADIKHLLEKPTKISAERETIDIIEQFKKFEERFMGKICRNRLWSREEILYFLEKVKNSDLSNKEIKLSFWKKKADEWVFEKNGHKWSNNNAEAADNYSSFLAGVDAVLATLRK